MWDILTFNNFIAQDVLILFYYSGAILVPLVLYYYKDDTVKYLDKKGLHFSVLVIIFLCAELCWRMVFEAMIGYFDMHDYMHEIVKKLS